MTEHKCYFCKTTLVSISDVDDNILVCKNCPEVINNIESVWRYKYILSFEDGKIESAYLYYKNIGKWLEVFYKSNEMYIANNSAKRIHFFDFAINVYDYSEQEIEKKIKTWTLLG